MKTSNSLPCQLLSPISFVVVIPDEPILRLQERAILVHLLNGSSVPARCLPTPKYRIQHRLRLNPSTNLQFCLHQQQPQPLPRCSSSSKRSSWFSRLGSHLHRSFSEKTRLLLGAVDTPHLAGVKQRNDDAWALRFHHVELQSFPPWKEKYSPNPALSLGRKTKSLTRPSTDYTLSDLGI